MLAAQMTGAAEKTVTIANMSWEPYYGQYLPNYGFVPEIIKEAYARTGYTAEFSFMSWTKTLEDVRQGKYDAAATASFNEERDRIYWYSDSYIESPVVFYKRKNEKPMSWRNLEDLKPYRIGVVRSYVYSPEFDNAAFLQKRTSKNELLNMKKLLLKQAELILIDKFVGQYIINKKLVASEKNVPEIIYPQLVSDKLHLIFSKNVPDATEKRDAFNRGLREIVKDGIVKKILAAHGLGK